MLNIRKIFERESVPQFKVHLDFFQMKIVIMKHTNNPSTVNPTSKCVSDFTLCEVLNKRSQKRETNNIKTPNIIKTTFFILTNNFFSEFE